MAIYRFRVTFEDYEDVYREIDMPSKATFLELHQAIHNATGYTPDVSSSFYVSNDQWKKGTEIAFLPTERKQSNGVIEMEGIRLSKFIDDPHQKFYYIYNFDRPYDFHVELIKILKEEDGKEYPCVFKAVGTVPKPVAAANFPLSTAEDDDEDEDLPTDDTEYGVDEDEEFDLFDGEEEEGGEDEGASGVEDEY
ncbi:plasmid pRiA4b ORF-3 family protein [Sphingobacterium phlebotomi]|uniref:Plasmid pRiA4b ORF-3 family protein n=1 Tax=Sphingobacterium phlebotomi TaxID=2605433 RepID=A0A5D4GYQ0_9SPHI|nr:plasmid pRiA4b ORF-3 family protein [Sphingobacterium phlebotomi]TYR33941.1 plasmid pRiA4b ORF-3 family protein [Sphingobacterium phlebotomi]